MPKEIRWGVISEPYVKIQARCYKASGDPEVGANLISELKQDLDDSPESLQIINDVQKIVETGIHNEELILEVYNNFKAAQNMFDEHALHYLDPLGA